MSNFKGTKGNWYLNDTDHEIFGKDDNYHMISCGDKGVTNGFSIAGFLPKEDALLITKAPEMLEMLEKVERTLREIYECDTTEINQLIKEATEL